MTSETAFQKETGQTALETAAVRPETPRQPEALPLRCLLTSYLVGYGWVCSFFLAPVLCVAQTHWVTRIPPWMPLAFSALFFAWAAWCLRQNRQASTARPAGREHWFWLVCALTVGLGFALSRVNAARLWAWLALHGFAAYWVVCRAGLLAEGTTGVLLPLDALYALVGAPFGGIFLRLGGLFRAVRGRVAARRSGQTRRVDLKNTALGLLVLLLCLPFLGAAAGLLGQADEAFAAVWEQFLGWFRFDWQLPWWTGELWTRILLSLPVGAYLYGLVARCARQEAPPMKGAVVREEAEKLRFAPLGAVTAALGLFCALYALFFGVQLGHLFAAFSGVVPGAYTASAYAREGFFQLCQVMGINFGLLGAVWLFGRVSPRKSRGLRIAAALLMAESLLLAVTAAGRLGLYIQRFGWTGLRVLSAWGIFVLAAGAILTLVSLFRPCRGAQKWIWLAAGSFSLLCLY